MNLSAVRRLPKGDFQNTAKGWNQFVDGFDAQGFAEEMVDGKVGWVIFCLDDHYFSWPCAPNQTFDHLDGIRPG
jgi:hypothetical protein